MGPEGGPNAGGGVAGQGPWPRGIEAEAGGGGSRGHAEGHGRRRTGGPTPRPKGGRPFSPLLTPRRLTLRGGRAPPQNHGGAGRRAEAGRPTDSATMSVALTSAPRSPHERESSSGRAGCSGTPGHRLVRPSRFFAPRPERSTCDRGWPRRIHLGTWAMAGCVARGACRKALRVGKPPRESRGLPQRFLYV